MLGKHFRHVGFELVGQLQDIRHGRIEFALGETKLRPLLCDSAGANRRGAAMLRRYMQVMSHGTLAGDTPSGNRADARHGHNGLILHLRERKR